MGISEVELRDALLAWHGYVNMPTAYIELFDRFDLDHNGSLDKSELQALLTKIAGVPVSESDVTEVLRTADVLGDGVINKEELLGAVGAWYVSVGREPTPSMSIAFVELNRTPGAAPSWCLFLTAANCMMLCYIALDAGIHAGHACGRFLPSLLIADGMLWELFAVFVFLKGRWVQFLNICLPAHRAAGLLSRIAGAIVICELTVMTCLVLVESVGLVFAFSDKGIFLSEVSGFSEEEMQLCLSTNSTASQFNKFMQLPGNLVDFGMQYFSMWALPNSVLTLLYGVYVIIRTRRAIKQERNLQSAFAEADSADSDWSSEESSYSP